jgi:mRNA-degrading endonuclease RelE of RelBE toxin-antitoxin system
MDSLTAAVTAHPQFNRKSFTKLPDDQQDKLLLKILRDLNAARTQEELHTVCTLLKSVLGLWRIRHA